MWLATETGLHFTCWLVSRKLLGDLRVEGLKGSLLGLVQVESLSYHGNRQQCHLSGLSLRCKRAALLKGKVHIRHIAVDRFSMDSQGDAALNVSQLTGWEVDHAIIKEAVWKAKDFALSLTGEVGRGKQLSVSFKGYNLAWQGNIHFMEDAKRSILAQGTNTQNAAVKVTAHYRYPQWLIHIKHSDWQKHTNHISLVAAKGFPYRLFDPETISLKLSACLKDLSFLDALGFKVSNYVPTPLLAPIVVEGRIQGTVRAFDACLANPKEYLLKSKQASAIKATLSAFWKAPRFESLGSFSAFSLGAKWQRGHIVWDAQLTKPQDLATQPLSTWRVTGKTQFVSKSITGGKQTISSKSLNAVTQLALRGDPMRLFESSDYVLSSIPQVDIHILNQSIKVSGDLDIPYGSFTLAPPKAEGKLDTDLHFIHAVHKELALKYSLSVQLNLRLGKDVILYYSGLKARLAGSLMLRKAVTGPLTAKGEINLIEGNYYCLGEHLEVDSPSRLIFLEHPYNPFIDLKASRSINVKPSNRLLSGRPLQSTPLAGRHLSHAMGDLVLPQPIRVGVHLYGELNFPVMRLFSSPPGSIADPADRLSYLLTGQPVCSLNESAVALLLNTVAQLQKGYTRHYNSHFWPQKHLGMHVDFQSDELLQATYLVLSKAITPKLTVHYKEGLSHREVAARYALSPHIVTQLNVSWRCPVGAELAYRREWEQV